MQEKETSDNRAPTRARLRLSLGSLGGKLGLALAAGGFMAIGYGWYNMAGAASRVNGVTDLHAQLPYMLSGGLIGLALVVVGAALFVTDAMRTDREILVRHMLELAEAITEGPRDIAAASPHNVGLVVHAGRYHRSDCPTVRGLASLPATTSEAAVHDELVPCRVCRPEGSAEQTGTRQPPNGQAASTGVLARRKGAKP